ncbi:MAG TPA: glycoside hydrolase family 18 protein [Longimicrobiales bacterium]
MLLRPRIRPAALLAAVALAAACASRAPVVRYLTPTPATPAQRGEVPGVASRRVVGYFFGKGVLRGVKVANLRGDRLTHLIYAFADIGPDGLARLEDPCVDVGQCVPGAVNPYPEGGVFEQLRQLKQRYPHLRILLSFGGWGRSGYFSDAAATPESRAAFIDSSVRVFLDRYPGLFDGFDLDWEFPVRGGLPTNSYRPDDRANLSALVEELRARLDREDSARGKHYELTIASPAGPGHMGNQDLVRMAASIDFYNVMCYNYHGSSATYFNAPLFPSTGDPAPRNNVDWTVRAYLELGIPAYKIVVGVPFYAVSYAGVPDVANGLFQPVRRDSAPPAAAVAAAPALTPAKAAPATSPATPVVAAAEASGAGVATAPAAAPQRPWGAGGFRYPMLAEAQRRGFRLFRHKDAGVPWLYHPGTGVFINFDDPRSLALKGQYVKRNDLGGLMIWEIGSDTTGVLLQAVWKALR